MLMYKKISYLLILIFWLIISCSNASTNPNIIDNQNTSDIKAVVSGMHYVQYGKCYSNVNAENKDDLQKLWINYIYGKIVYKDENFTSINGKFGDKGDYYDNNDSLNPRTKIVNTAVYEYNNKKYLAGIYWDNKIGIGMQSRYRVIIVDEESREIGFYGGGSDDKTIPDKNTKWTKYDFVFGYLRDY